LLTNSTQETNRPLKLAGGFQVRSENTGSLFIKQHKKTFQRTAVPQVFRRCCSMICAHSFIGTPIPWPTAERNRFQPRPESQAQGS